MITSKQIKFYKNILAEIVNADINLKYNGYMLKSLSSINTNIEDKVKAYHLFFKTISLNYPENKKVEGLTHLEFNLFLEEIREILADNGYILKHDIISFNNMIRDSKKTTCFQHFLK